MGAPLDVALAHRLSSLALQAYWHDSFEPWALAQGFTEPERFHEGSLQAKLLRDRDRLLLVFAGTDLFNLREWFGYDFDMRHQPMLGGWVHKGFWRALHARSRRSEHDLFAQIVASLAARFARHGVLPIHVGGHSLGAAMAKMFAAELADHARRGVALPIRPEHVTSIVTTGEPRIGDARQATALERTYDGRMHRGAFGRDWVPQVPIRSLGYRHSGTPHVIERDGTILRDTERVYHRTSSADHLPQRYERAYANHLFKESGEPPMPIGRTLRRTLKDVYEVAFHPGRGRDRSRRSET